MKTLKLYLTTLQLEGYDILRFIKWIIKNYSTKTIEIKKNLVITPKIKLIILLSIILSILLFSFSFLISNNLIIPLLVIILIATQSYILFILSTLILKPFEYAFKTVSIIKTKYKITANKKLKVIAITGSYGKTSIKEILYQLIKDKYKTLRTPESYNTIFGISKMIDFELDETYEIFICEMAAYKKGDIKELCNMVPPHYGILTGITTQHLERFGNLNNIIKTKFELYDSIKNKENMVINLNNQNIISEVKKRNIIKPIGYIKATNMSFSKNGSEFEFTYKNKRYQVTTKLFGIFNIENILGALTMALKLNIDTEYLIKKINKLVPIQSRFVLKTLDNSTLVDNTFSSNEVTFKKTIETAKMVNGKKVLITPGLVELGEHEEKINFQIGSLAKNVFGKIILVGNNKRTQSFAKSFKTKPEFINDTREEYFKKINDLKDNYEWIFLENDITQNY